MIKILAIAVLILLSGSCCFYIYQEDFKTVDDVLIWITENIEYIPDDIDYWQCPAETLERKAGDCEDFCILFMWILHDRFDLKPDMLVVKNGGEYHCLVRDVLLYDVTAGKIIAAEPEIDDVIGYDEIFD